MGKFYAVYGLRCPASGVECVSALTSTASWLNDAPPSEDKQSGVPCAGCDMSSCPCPSARCPRKCWSHCADVLVPPERIPAKHRGPNEWQAVQTICSAHFGCPDVGSNHICSGKPDQPDWPVWKCKVNSGPDCMWRCKNGTACSDSGCAIKCDSGRNEAAGCTSGKLIVSASKIKEILDEYDRNAAK